MEVAPWVWQLLVLAYKLHSKIGVHSEQVSHIMTSLRAFQTSNHSGAMLYMSTYLKAAL
jgi:hypothetical protein